jgi:putative oxidoreductase
MIRSQDAGKAVLRVSLSLLLLLHGVDKLVHGLGPVLDIVVARGLPGFLAYGVLLGEVIAPLFVLFGYRARIAALVIVVNMGTAIYLAHASELFHLGEHGGWAVELAGLYLSGALAVAFLGAGRYSISRGRTRWD